MGRIDSDNDEIVLKGADELNLSSPTNSTDTNAILEDDSEFTAIKKKNSTATAPQATKRRRIVVAIVVAITVLVVIGVFAFMLDGKPDGPHWPKGGCVVEPDYDPDSGDRPVRGPPLRLLRITAPNEGRLSGRDALTFTFSRPLIALGGNFNPEGGDEVSQKFMSTRGVSPIVWKYAGQGYWGQTKPPMNGTLRWVTTSILRFDPDEDWLNDFEFSITPNHQVRTWDGELMQTDIPAAGPKFFTTGGLVGGVDAVESEMAKNATDGRWSSFAFGDHNGQQVGFNECPPDAVIRMSFSSPVAISKLAEALVFNGKAGERLRPRQVRAQKGCLDSELCNQVLVELPAQGLTPNTKYSLGLPKGSKVTHGNATREAQWQILSGILPFTFDWNDKFAHRSQRLHVRHGLGVNVTDADLSKSISVSPKIANLKVRRVSKTEIALDGNWEDKAYEITLDGNVKTFVDGFGQVVQGQKKKFLPLARSAYLAYFMGHLSVYAEESAVRPNFTAYGRVGLKSEDPPQPHTGSCPRQLNVKSIPLNEKSIIEALQNVRDCRATKYWDGTTSYSLGQITDGSKNPPTQTLQDLSGGAYLDTGLAAVRFGLSAGCPDEVQQKYHHTSCDIQMAGDIGIITQQPTYDSIYVWVVNVTTGQDVPNAAVIVAESGNSFEVVARGITDANGAVTFTKIDVDNGYSFNVIGFTNHSIGMTNLYAFHNMYSAKIGSVFTDREVYRVGDTMHVQGYIRGDNGETLSAAQLEGLEISVDWKGYTGEKVWSTPAEIKEDFGSFSATFEVPKDVVYGYHSVMAILADGSQVTSAMFKIADPKVPTASLSVDVDESFFNVNSNTLPFNVSTSLYTGHLVRGSHVKGRWSITPSNQIGGQTNYPDVRAMGKRRPRKALAQSSDGAQLVGEFEIDLPEGQTQFNLELPDETLNALKNRSDADSAQHFGDILVTVDWFGPSRELLTKTFSLAIRKTAWETFLSPQGDVLPGLPQNFTLDVTMPVNDGQGKLLVAIIGAEVRVIPLNDSFGQQNGPNTQNWKNIFHQAGDQKNVELAQMPSDYEGKASFQASVEVILPRMGIYAVVAKVVDVAGNELFVGSIVGRTELQWRYSPLSQVSWVQSDFTVERVGTKAVVSWKSNPFRDAVALVSWGTGKKASPNDVKRFKTRLGASKAIIEVPLTDSGCDTMACWLGVAVVGPAGSLTGLPKVHVSELLDVNLPIFITSNPLTLPAPKAEKLDIKITSPGKVQPGAEVSVEVEVNHNGKSVENAEVALWVSFKPVVDLGPRVFPKPEDFYSAFHPQFALGDSSLANFQSSINEFTSRYSMKNATLKMERRQAADPWAFGSYGVYPMYGDDWALIDLPSRQSRQGWDRPDDLFLACQRYELTQSYGYSPSLCEEAYMARDSSVAYMSDAAAGGMERAMDGQMPGMMYKKSSGAEPPNGGDDAVQGEDASVRSAFTILAFAKSHLITDKNGRVSISFTAPGNVGSWIVRAVAVDKEAVFGTNATEIVSARMVNLQSSMPRVVRVWDEFTAGVTVTLEDESQGEILVDVSIALSTNVVTIAGNVTSRSIKLIPFRPQEVLFSFRCVAVGELAAVFEVRKSGGMRLDALQENVPARGISPPVFLATSFALSAVEGSTAGRTEGIVLPHVSSGNNTVSVLASVGRYAAVEGAVNAVLSRAKEIENVGTYDLIGSLFGQFLFGAYDRMNEQNEAVKAAMVALDELANRYTHDQLGLQYQPNPTYPLRSLELNAWAVLGWRTLTTAPPESFPSGGRRTNEAASAARNEAYKAKAHLWAEQIHTAVYENYLQYEECVKNSHYCHQWYFRPLTLARFALGSFEGGIDGSSIIPREYKDKLSTDALIAYLGSQNNAFDIETKCMAVLHILERGEAQKYKSFIQKVVEEAYGRFRVTARSAYISTAPGSQSRAPDSTNAFVLWMMAKADTESTNVDKLANFVASGAAPSSYRATFVYSPMGNVLRAVSLSAYDKVKGSTTPHLNVTTQLDNGTVVASWQFEESSQEPKSASYEWGQLLDHTTVAKQGIHFGVNGQGEVSVVLGMHFVPGYTLPRYDSINFGLKVDKAMYIIDPKTGGLRSLRHDEKLVPGSLVRVVIDVLTYDDLEGVVTVDDGLPGGLEALDPQLAAFTPPPMCSGGFVDGGVKPHGRRMRIKGGGFGGDFVGGISMPGRGIGGGSVGNGGCLSFGQSLSELYPKWAPWRWSFATQEVKKENVVCTAHRLSAGSHSCVYDAIVTTTGKFVMPPAKATFLPQPEVMGVSGLMSITIGKREE